MFPVIETDWAEAARAVEQLQPAAVLVAMSDADEPAFAALAAQIAARQPYLPLIAVDPAGVVARQRHSVFAKPTAISTA